MGDLSKNKKVLVPYTDKELIEAELYPADGESEQLKGRMEKSTDAPTASDNEPAAKKKKGGK